MATKDGEKPTRQIPDLAIQPTVRGDSLVPTQRAGDETGAVTWDDAYGFFKNRLIADNDASMTIGTVFWRFDDGLYPYALKLDGNGIVSKKDYPQFDSYVKSLARFGMTAGDAEWKFKDLGDSWKIPNLAGVSLMQCGHYMEDGVDKGIGLGEYKKDAMQRIQGETHIRSGLFDGKLYGTGVFKGVKTGNGGIGSLASPEMYSENILQFDSALRARTDTYTRNRQLGGALYIVITGHISVLSLNPSVSQVVNQVNTLEQTMRTKLATGVAEFEKTEDNDINDNFDVVEGLKDIDVKTLSGVNYLGEALPKELATKQIFGDTEKRDLTTALRFVNQHRILVELYLTGYFPDYVEGDSTKIVTKILDADGATDSSYLVELGEKFDNFLIKMSYDDTLTKEPIKIKILKQTKKRLHLKHYKVRYVKGGA